MSLEIEASDVIRLIQQYLKENNLLNTLKALQDETSVSLNNVDSIETFVNDINDGKWDVVLKQVKLLKLPDDKLIDLYEQIAIELIELKENKAAKWLIYKTEPMLKLKSLNKDRYSHLQNLAERSYFDPKEAYRNNSTKDRRRNAIAQDLKKEVTVVPSQRLLTLIGEALKWQRQEGLLPTSSSIDIFTGKAHMVHAGEETYPSVLHKHCIKPLKTVRESDTQIFVCCSEFTPDGYYFIVGYSSGLVEARIATTGRFANDLKYQAQKDFIVTPSRTAALSICFTQNGDLLAIGDAAGDISIRKFETGELIQTIKAHSEGISCMLFHKNGKEILSSNLNKEKPVIKLHGMRSKEIIREFKGHKSFVNSIIFSRDYNYVISGSYDNTVRIWNAKTGVELKKIATTSKVHTIVCVNLNSKDDLFLIGTRAGSIQVIDIEGKLRTEIADDSGVFSTTTNEEMLAASEQKSLKSGNFYSLCMSPKGNWIYAVNSRNIFCFNYSTKKVQKTLTVHENNNNDIIGIKHHPFLNLLLTFDTDGNLKLWKA